MIIQSRSRTDIPAFYEKAIHNTMVFPKGKNARTSCACYLGGDIGMYNTCLHMCRYCYANYDEKTVMTNHANHDPHSPLSND